MAKRLTEKQKKAIIQNFIEGNTIDFLSNQFDCTKLTIIRNLKKNLGESRYQELIHKNRTTNNDFHENNKGNLNFNYELNDARSKEETINNKNLNENQNEDDYFSSSFLEITPLDYEIEEKSRKELSSIPISDIDFPKVVYMIVDKKIELEIKLLKDYPDWRFLPEEDLNRKTIEIYFELKNAKRFCNKDQKVIKVPNTDVFRIVAPILISRGISRIVSAEKLISL